MIEVNGKHNSGIIFSDVPDEGSINQIRELLDQEFFAGNKVRVMPDYHVGAGCTIGLTAKLVRQIISPNLVGVDIGCGMRATKIYGDLDFEKLDRIIRAYIPHGSATNKGDEAVHAVPVDEAYSIADLIVGLFCFKGSGMNLEYIQKSLGTLGSGNHFIEVNRDSNGDVWLVIHSGSRNLGVQVASYYQNLGWNKLNQTNVNKIIDDLKAQGRHSEIQGVIEQIKSESVDVPKSLAYVQGMDFYAYIQDMMATQYYAEENRKVMSEIIMRHMGWEELDMIESVHNYIDVEDMIMRKGACSAKAGQRLIIPINMRDGSIIAVGKGNDDWNQSAPHGSGRLLGRGQAKRSLSLEEFENEMSGIYTTSVSEGTLDESPMAYKGIDYIMRNIGDTVEIVDVIKPLYNFKGE